jgi:starvation-inducible DNA-binding protein
MPIALSPEVRVANAEMLNQILIDSVMMYQMYKKHHWQVLGPTFYQLDLLFDQHASEQSGLIDLVAERVQMLGDVAVAMPHDVAERTRIARPPAGAETPPAMLSRLLDAHEVVIGEVRAGIEQTERNQDWGSNDLLMSDVLRTHEKQVWFLSSHLVDLPLVTDRSAAA